MSLTRREAIAQLAALVALPTAAKRWTFAAADPLDGTVAEYQAGRRRGEWTAEQVATHALERCRTVGAKFRAIDALAADSSLADARASDARLRDGKMRGPLDGAPVFAKAIYDMNGLPTTGSSAEWARLFPEPVRRNAMEVVRLRA
ncbi:MAG: amidase family protein, partial [Gemmatimonadaceae bacterium]